MNLSEPETGPGDAEETLRRLIARYLPLVYQSARHRTGSEALAADVAQAVFADYSRRAASLPPAFNPGGWLLRHTGFLAARALRTERRRAARENEAARRAKLATDPAMSSPRHDEVDSALHQLSAPDQTVLVLRYYEGHEISGIAVRLGISSAAAQKRIERALERLRRRLPGKPEAAAVTGALALFLSPQSLHAAMPGTLTRRVTASALTAATRPLPAWSVWLRHLSPVAGAVAGAAAALALGGAPLVPWRTATIRPAMAITDMNPGSPAVPGLPSPILAEAPAVATAASVVDELRALVEREGYNRVAWKKAEALIGKIPREQCGEAVALLARVFPVRRFFANAGGPERWSDILLYRWKPDATDEALRFLLPKLPPGLRDDATFNLCQDWYRKDPAAATAWWHALLENSPPGQLPDDCRQVVIRRLGYWVLDALTKTDLAAAVAAAQRMESQGMASLFSTQSSAALQELVTRQESPAPADLSSQQTADHELSRRLAGYTRTPDSVAEALQIKDVDLRDYTLAVMIARDLSQARAPGASVLESADLPPPLARSLRQWLTLPP